MKSKAEIHPSGEAVARPHRRKKTRRNPNSEHRFGIPPGEGSSPEENHFFFTRLELEPELEDRDELLVDDLEDEELRDGDE